MARSLGNLKNSRESTSYKYIWALGSQTGTFDIPKISDKSINTYLNGRYSCTDLSIENRGNKKSFNDKTSQGNMGISSENWYHNNNRIPT